MRSSVARCREQQHLARWANDLEMDRKLDSVHLWHVDIGDQQRWVFDSAACNAFTGLVYAVARKPDLLRIIARVSAMTC